jgi:hypothetical protein
MRKIFLFCCVVSFFGCRPRQSFQVQLGIADVVITNEQLDSTAMILKRRLDLLKDEKAAIRVDRTNRQITIETFSIKNESEARYFASAGQVKFSECYIASEIHPVFKHVAELIDHPSEKNTGNFGISDLLTQEHPSDSLFSLLFVNQPGPGYIFNAAEVGFVRMRDTAKLRFLLTQLSPYLPVDINFLYSKMATFGKNIGEEVFALYAAKSVPEAVLDQEFIQTATGGLNSMGKPVIYVKFNQEGSTRWSAITKININRPIVVSVDGQVYAAPTVVSEIAGGNVEISGVFSVKEAESLANAISAGKLPLRLKVKSITKQ